MQSSAGTLSFGFGFVATYADTFPLSFDGSVGAPNAGTPVYLSPTTAGLATIVLPDPFTQFPRVIGSLQESGTSSLQLVLFNPSNTTQDYNVFELNLAFNTGSIPSNSNANLLPTTVTADLTSGLSWEWECPFDAKYVEIWVNALVFSGGGPLSVGMSKNGSLAFAGVGGINTTGLFHTEGAVTVAAGSRVGISISTGVANITTTAFTVRMRLR